MRAKSLLISVLTIVFLATAAFGCTGGGGDDDDDTAGPPDASTMPAIDAAPQPDAPPVGPANAASLGAACTMQMACPAGYECISLQANATQGFCTLPCNGQADTTTCSNMFAGPGMGQCFIVTAQGAPPSKCGVACAGVGGACPTGMQCLLDGNMSPATLEICSNPPAAP